MRLQCGHFERGARGPACPGVAVIQEWEAAPLPELLVGRGALKAPREELPCLDDGQSTALWFPEQLLRLHVCVYVHSGPRAHGWFRFQRLQAL